METQKHICKNCASEFSGNFCNVCGQKASVQRVTFKETFSDFFETVFSVNAPFVKTFKLLFANPGMLFSEYLSGKRKTYYKPVAFFLIITLIHIVIRNLIQFDALENVTPRQSGGIDTTNVVKAGKFMFQNINNLLFVFVATIALMLKLFFYKKFYLAEYIAIAFYLVSAYTVIGTFNAFYMKFINAEVQFLALFVMLVYYCYALLSLFKKPAFAILLKGVLSYILATILYMILAFGLSFVIVLIKG